MNLSRQLSTTLCRAKTSWRSLESEVHSSGIYFLSVKICGTNMLRTGLAVSMKRQVVSLRSGDLYTWKYMDKRLKTHWGLD